tara:strand:- start:1862 stop:2956 length:1095 start_codon:yes stop_codon:yes gene_type:complete
MPYIGKGANGFGIRERYRFSASSGQTNFSGTDLDGKTLQFDSGSLVDIYLNGVLLDTSDVNLNTANTLILNSGASASDEVMIIVYDVFSLSDALSKSGGAMSGSITNFTSTGIDDNADATTITLDANEDITASNGMYVSGDLTSLTVDKGGIDRSGNTTRIISARSGGNFADMSINVAGVDKSDGNSGMNRCLYIDYQGNTTIDQGNLVIGTSGKGISFSATADGSGANQSELLDDYEQGTWTPTLVNGGSVTVSNARYTKIGQLVYAGTYSGFSSIPNNSSRLEIGGLPFAVAGGGAYHGSGSISFVSTFNWNGTGSIGAPTPNSAQSSVYFHRGDASSANILNSAVTGLSAFIFAVVYITDS